MRTEEEMYRLIISTAQEDERIRAAYLTGSRVNPNAPKDIFQDYDVMYVVRETLTFRQDREWIDRFGERLYMQYPEEGPFSSSDTERCYGWLMQFADGNRLDLHVCTQDYLEEGLEKDPMFKVLLDKDKCLPDTDCMSDQAYWVKPLTQEEFSAVCNEFWWCMNNVAKGLWRREVTYVMDMINENVRPMLTHLMEFKIGLENNFSVSVGKHAKYMNRFLPDSLWQRYLSTFAPAAVKELWDSVFLMCDLFGEIVQETADKAGFYYNLQEAQNSRQYLEHVQALPEDALQI